MLTATTSAITTTQRATVPIASTVSVSVVSFNCCYAFLHLVWLFILAQALQRSTWYMYIHACPAARGCTAPPVASYWEKGSLMPNLLLAGPLQLRTPCSQQYAVPGGPGPISQMTLPSWVAPWLPPQAATDCRSKGADLSTGSLRLPGLLTFMVQICIHWTWQTPEDDYVQRYCCAEKAPHTCMYTCMHTF